MSSDSWTFLTNHTRVLLRLAQQPGARLRDVSSQIGITERATQRIVADLVEAGYLERQRVGRRNRYSVNRDRALRHEAEHGHEIGELLTLLGLEQPPSRR